jgi:Gpi18-like mannosyltransferase
MSRQIYFYTKCWSMGWHYKQAICTWNDILKWTSKTRLKSAEKNGKVFDIQSIALHLYKGTFDFIPKSKAKV